MKSCVDALYELYCELTGSKTEVGGQAILPGGFYFSPEKSAQKGCDWVEVVPAIHNPNGMYSRSAALRVYSPKERADFHDELSILEFQAFESDKEKVHPSVLMFFRDSGSEEDIFIFCENAKQFFKQCNPKKLSSV